MRFADIPGNEDIRRALTGMADSGRVAHAMLFYENEGCGALPLVLAYFQYLNCQDRHDGDSCGECPSCRKISRLIHPDLHFVFPVNTGSKVSASEKPVSDTYMEYWRDLVLADPYFLESELYSALGIEGKSGNIAVAEAKSVISKLSLSSVEDGYRAIVVWLPEKMNAEAANRLLKIVEEPPQLTLFLMITHHPEQVLQTISSRCLHIQVERAGTDGPAVAFQSPELFDGLMDALCSRDLLSCHEAADRLSALPSREDAKAFCKFAAYRLRHIFLAQQGLPLPPDAGAQVARWAPLCRKSFPRNALGVLDRASRMLDLNVNVKILFADI